MKKTISTLVFIFLFTHISTSQQAVLDSVISQISIDSLRLYTRQLSGDTSCVIGGSPYTILSRHKLQPGNQKAAEYIYEKFGSFGLNTQYETFSSTGANVIGTKTGTHFPNRYYVICGHFDDMPSGTVAPGADDNASGTAAVIEIARIFSKYNFQYSVKFIGFDEEEQGLIGSAYYATQAKNRNDSIMGVINLDMIGFHSSGTNIINVHTKNVANTQEIGADVVSNISSFGLAINPVIVASQPYSDHESFLQKGYGAILLIEDNNNFNPYYHTVNDKMMYINMPYFHKITKATAVTIAKYAMNLKIVIDHTPVVSSNSTGSNTASTKLISGLTIGSGSFGPRLYYRVDTGSGFGSFNFVTDADGPTGNDYEFIIPGQPLGTIVEYYIAAQDQAGAMVQTLPAGGSGINPPGINPPSTMLRFYVANQMTVFDNNCSSLSDWTSNSIWGITTTTFVSAPSSFTDSPAGNYSNSTTNTLTLNDTISLRNYLSASLRFSAKWDLESGYDYVQIMISTNNGTNWTPLAGKFTKSGAGSFQPAGQPLYNGVQTVWQNEEVDLSSYIGKSVKFRYNFRSDGSIQRDGFYVDDIKVAAYQAPVTSITYSDNSLPEGFQLFQNYPNPFNASSIIKYSIPSDGHVELEVFNMLGQRILTLVNENQKAGLYQSEFSGYNYPSGVYLFKLSFNNSIITQKGMLIK